MTSPQTATSEFSRKLRASRNQVQRDMLESFIIVGCLNCLFWKKNDTGYGGCSRYMNQRPPDEVIVFGCAEWEQDLPF